MLGSELTRVHPDTHTFRISAGEAFRSSVYKELYLALNQSSCLQFSERAILLDLPPSISSVDVVPELHADLFSRHASPLEVCVLWRSTKEVKMLCPTRFVVDATENSKEGGVAADVCNILLLLPGSPK